MDPEPSKKEEVGLELQVLMLTSQLISQPEQGKSLQERTWVKDEGDVGQSFGEGPELHMEAIAIVRWELV